MINDLRDNSNKQMTEYRNQHLIRRWKSITWEGCGESQKNRREIQQGT